MFLKSKVLIAVDAYCKQIDKDDILHIESAEFYKHLFMMLEENNITCIDFYKPTTCYVVESNNLLKKLLLEEDILNYIVILRALSELGINVVDDYNIEFMTRYTTIKSRIAKFTDAVKYLENAYDNYVDGHFRDSIKEMVCVLECVFENLLSKHCKNMYIKVVKLEKQGFILADKDLSVDGYKTAVLSLADDRNKKGAHGTQVYAELSQKEIELCFISLCKILEHTELDAEV